MKVVAPHLSLRSHRAWQAAEEFLTSVAGGWMDQPWQPPSAASLMYDGGGEGGEYTWDSEEPEWTTGSGDGATTTAQAQHMVALEKSASS